jgi:hypothetical protein
MWNDALFRVDRCSQNRLIKDRLDVDRHLNKDKLSSGTFKQVCGQFLEISEYRKLVLFLEGLTLS